MPVTFADIEESVIDAQLNLNIKSVIYGIKFAMAAMKDKGIKGSILVNSSVMSHAPKSNTTGGGVYAATKAAADMLVQYAAVEGAADDSGVLTLCFTCPSHAIVSCTGVVLCAV